MKILLVACTCYHRHSKTITKDRISIISVHFARVTLLYVCICGCSKLDTTTAISLITFPSPQTHLRTIPERKRNYGGRSFVRSCWESH